MPKDIDKNLKREIDLIIKPNGLLAKHTIKNEISQLFPKYKNGNDIYEHKKSKTNKPHKFALNLLLNRFKVDCMFLSWRVGISK